MRIKSWWRYGKHTIGILMRAPWRFMWRVVFPGIIWRDHFGVDPETINRPQADDVCLFVVVRNEAHRLPFFLSYYRAQGVTRFFVIDHGSSDSTQKDLAADHDVNTFVTSAPFSYKSVWLEVLLDRFGVGRWNVVTDIDEFLVIPPPYQTIPELTSYLDEGCYSAVQAYLLDMYPPRSLTETVIGPADDLFQRLPYFDDPRFVRTVRERVFGLQPDLRKAVLIQWRRWYIIRPGQHYVLGARYAPMQCVMCHFKFAADFLHDVSANERRPTYIDQTEYRTYARQTTQQRPLNFYDKRYSIYYESAQTLSEVGILFDGSDEDRKNYIEATLTR